MRMTFPGLVKPLSAGLACAASLVFNLSYAQSIDPAFADKYTAIDLGVTPVFNQNGGSGQIAAIVFKDANTLLVAVNDNDPNGEIDAVTVQRDANQHITGFSSPTFVSNAPNIDGGMQYAPNGVLLYTAYSHDAFNTLGYNTLGEIKPGSSNPDTTISLTSSGVTPSVGSLAFVPSGFSGAGEFKLVSWDAQTWYSSSLTPDGSGTYSVGNASNPILLPHYTEGIGYVKAGNPHFGVDSVLLAADHPTGTTPGDAVFAYQIDSDGNPITATRQHFADVPNAYGMTFDPVTGDLLVSTEQGTSFQHITEIQGFTPVPEPRTTAAAAGFGLLLFALLWRRKNAYTAAARSVIRSPR